MKFPVKDLFSKCDQISRKLRIWSDLLEKSLMNLCAVKFANLDPHYWKSLQIGFNHMAILKVMGDHVDFQFLAWNLTCIPKWLAFSILFCETCSKKRKWMSITPASINVVILDLALGLVLSFTVGSHHSCSIKKAVLKNFAKFTGKHLRQGLFFN